MAKPKPLPNSTTLDPTQSLTPALELARSFYARALADLISHRDAAQGNEAVAWQLLFKRVAHDAVWAVTELHRGAETKYFSQRFISARAQRHWAEASSRGECEKGIQHEHVVEMREIKLQLQKARNEDDFYSALSTAVACVVTVKDHEDLERKGKHLRGWERYEKAGVAVWDRLELRWYVAPATGRNTELNTNLQDAIEPSLTVSSIAAR